MPAIQRSEFYLALNQVATERGVDVAVILETVENAILAAFRKDHPDIVVEEYSVKLNSNTGEAKVFHGEEDVTPPGFGRIAAQTAKQVILQKVREKEKEAILSDFSTRIGSIISGMVLRFAGPNVIVDLGKTEAIMPPQDQIPTERYHVNQRLSFYIVEIREGLKGQELIVSRANPGLLEGLFKREVPELAQGSVVVKAIAREAGSRSKVAVASTQSGIDPVGSLVGQKGVRVQAVIQEFGGLEKIDIIQWSEDIKGFIGASLSPAKNVTITLDEDNHTAFVATPTDQLSIAIGKEGQNVRLASKLTGWRIEIKERELTEEEKEAQAKAASDVAKAAADAKALADKEAQAKAVEAAKSEEQSAKSEGQPEPPTTPTTQTSSTEISPDVILGNEVTPESTVEAIKIDAGQASMTTKEPKAPEEPKVEAAPAEPTEEVKAEPAKSEETPVAQVQTEESSQPVEAPKEESTEEVKSEEKV